MAVDVARHCHLHAAVEDDAENRQVVAMAAGGLGPSEVQTAVKVGPARRDAVEVERTLEQGFHDALPHPAGPIQHQQLHTQ